MGNLCPIKGDYAMSKLMGAKDRVMGLKAQSLINDVRGKDPKQVITGSTMRYSKGNVMEGSVDKIALKAKSK